jgi:large subunit ribosomal protein L29
MAILRSDEIQGMDDSEMDERLTQLRKELMKIRGVLASGGIPEEVGKAREIKRTIARIKTIKAQRDRTANKGGPREVSGKK